MRDHVRRRLWPVLALACVVLLSCALANAQRSSRRSRGSSGSSSWPEQHSFRVGQRVEIRKGSESLEGTIVKSTTSGRRFEVKLDDGTSDWYGPEQMRAIGGEPAAGPDDAKEDAKEEPTTKPAKATPPLKPARGMRLEVKAGDRWRKATVTNKASAGWVLVRYDDWREYEWVEPWRLRPLGSAIDEIGHAKQNQTLRKPQPPPKEKPGPATTPLKEEESIDDPWADRVSGRDERNGRDVVANSGGESEPVAKMGSEHAAPKRKEVKEPAKREVAPEQKRAEMGDRLTVIRRALDASIPRDVSGKVVLPVPANVGRGRVADLTPQSLIDWGFRPEPVTLQEKLTDKPIALSGNMRGYFGKPKRLILTAITHGRVFVVMDPRSWPPSEDRFLEVVDLAAGKSLGVLALPTGMVVNDIAPSGQRALLSDLAQPGTTGHGRLLHLFKIDEDGAGDGIAGKLVYEQSFEPFREADKFSGNVVYARFADDANVVTVNNDAVHPRGVGWDLNNRRATWSVAANISAPNPPVAMIRGRQALVTSVKITDPASESRTVDHVVLVNPLTGGLLGVLPPLAPWKHYDPDGMDLSPDGRRLAVFTQSWMTIHDLTDPAGTRQFIVPRTVAGRSLRWLDERYLLVAGKYLFDADRGFVLWRYLAEDLNDSSEGLISDGDWFGNRRLVLRAPGGDAESFVVPIRVPLDEPKKMAAALKDGDVFAAAAGMSVSLDVDLTGMPVPDNVKKAVRDALVGKLTALGYQVADGQAVVFSAKGMETSEKVALDYQDFTVDGTAVGGGVEQREIAIYLTSLSVRVDGNRVWSIDESHAPPRALKIVPGMTLDALIAAERLKFLDWFKNAEVPDRIPKTQENPGFGETDLKGGS